MSKFYYDVEKVKDVQSKINSLQSDLDHAKSKLNANIFALSTQNRPLLSALGSKKDGVKACINSMRNDMKNIDVLKERIGLLNSTLEDITTLVTECEDDAQFKIEGFKEYNGDNPALDDVGQFGGDQGSPQGAFYRDVQKNFKNILQIVTKKDTTSKEFKDLADIVKKYYPNMNDYEIIKYLERANEHGCGYVALTNTIYEIFKDKPEEFEKTFGFPMYKNGDLNFDELFIDLYSSEYDVTNGDGTDQYDQEIIMEQYCKKHNIPVDVKPNVNVTPENFEKISKKGQISILAYDHYELYNPKTGKTKTLSAGHSMSVIGTTEDNRYIVSSWGEKYYLQIDNDTRYTFVQIQYKEV